MKMNAHTENTKTMAAALGINEDKAEKLLDISILITCEAGDEIGKVFVEELKLLLERTITSVQFDCKEVECTNVEIIVGNCAARTDADLLYVYLRGNSAVISGQNAELCAATSTICHPVFLLLTACYTAAKALACSLASLFPYRVEDPLVLDFKAMLSADLEILKGPTDIQTTYLAGAGAVGNAFIYALRYFDVCGTIHVVDPKKTTEGNLNRCMLFTREDLGLSKAERLVEKAKPYFKNVDFVARENDLRNLSEKDTGPWLNRLVVTVDSRRVRRHLQSEIPCEVYDASTTGIQEVVLHFNKQPLEGKACMSCIYVEEEGELSHEQHVAEVLGVPVDKVHQNLIDDAAAYAIAEKYTDIIPDAIIGTAYDSLFKQMCGQGKLQAADKQVLAPFAFVSVLAGAMLAIEMIRRVNTGQVVEPFNYWRLSPYAAPVLRGRITRGKIEKCEFCDNPWLGDVAESLWGN